MDPASHRVDTVNRRATFWFSATNQIYEELDTIARDYLMLYLSDSGNAVAELTYFIK